jgi:SAM-dependent methyltransferase
MSQRFTETWDAIDPFDRGFPHLWIKVEHLGRYLFATDYLAARKAATVVDVGCGTGYGALELRRACAEVIGIDADPGSVAAARTRAEGAGVRILHHTLGEGSLTDTLSARPVDAVVAFETIEHLLNPEAAMADIASIVTPGGTLIVSVPGSLSEATGQDGLLINHGHKRAFTYSSLERLLDVAGFETEQWLGQAAIGDIARKEAMLIRRGVIDGRIGDCPELHSAEYLRRLSFVLGYPTQRDVERSYSMIAVATKKR